MKKQIASVVFTILLLVPSMVQAHGGRHHKTLMGTVRAIDASHIDLTTREGKRVSVPLVKGTMFMRGDKMAGAGQVKRGTRVVIELGEDDKSAGRVRIGIEPAKK